MSVPIQSLSPTFHPAYVRLLCMLLRKHGVETQHLLAGTGLSWERLVESGRGISFMQMRTLILAALKLTGAPGLGLELGAGIPVSAHGPVGYAAVAGKDVRQVLDVIVRYGILRNSALAFRLTESETHARLQIRERVDLGEVRVPLLEAVLIVLVQLIEASLGHPLERAEYALPFARPAWANAYDARLKGQVRFDATWMEISLPRALLDAPCLTADPAAYARAIRDCEQTLAHAVQEGDVVQQVRMRLQGRGGRIPGCEAMASELHMSGRTLIRRLGQQGTSYQALVDEVRKDEAQWYLRHTQHTVETIAERLGFVDTTNFSRSFRRWFGTTPRAFRQAATKADGG